jgi:D-3-phosphoglycerate dehydrogenase
MPEEEAEVKKVGAELVLADCRNEDETIVAAKDADAIITAAAKISNKVMAALPRLKVVVRYGVGYDTIDVPAATANNVVVVNIPDFCLEEVSNHAMALLLACAKKLTIMHNGVRAGDWIGIKKQLSPMGSIWGEKLGIIGCGNIGRRTAKKARCFDLDVIGYDPYADPSVLKEWGITPVSMEELLKESDYITIHTFLSDETRHLFGEKEFSQMKPSAYLINTSRGPVVDEPAMIKALQEKKIAGAGLDVFEQEPVDSNNPLLAMDNVIVLPHTASYSDAAFKRLRTSVGAEVARVITGHKPLHIVNRDVKSKIELK